MGESPRIGILLGDTEIDSSQSDSSLSISENEMETISLHVYGLIVALIGTLVAIIGHSFLIVTAKALVSDIVVTEEQPAVQLVGVMMLRLNDLVYYLFAALLSQSKYFYDIVYGIGIVIVVISAIVTLCVTKEEQWKTKTSCGKQMISIGSAIKHCPKKMIILFAITFVFFIGMGPYLMNINNFVGVNLFHGNSLENDDKYNKGIQMSLYSLALASFIAAICSFVFPLILHGKEMIFHISGIFFLMIAMLGYVGLNYIAQLTQVSQTVISVLLACIGTILQISMIVPFATPLAVFKKVCPQRQMGVYTGMLMSLVMLANMISSFISGILIDAFDDTVSVFIYESVCMFIAFLLSFIMIYVNKETKSVDELNSYQSIDTTSMIERVDLDYQQFDDSENYHNAISTEERFDENSSLL